MCTYFLSDNLAYCYVTNINTNIAARVVLVVSTLWDTLAFNI